MKVNIQKLQGGGVATFTPIIHTAATPTQSGGTNSTSTAKTQTSLLDDETYKELLTKGGLVNDTNALVAQLIELESSQDFLSPDALYGSSTKRTSALRWIMATNELRQAKADWGNAMDNAKASGGLDEVAVQNSRLYIKDKDGKVSTIALAEYGKQAGKVHVLSVAELLNERQYNPNLVGRNDVFTAANSSIGIEKITDQIKGLISAISLEEISDTRLYPREQFQAIVNAGLGPKPTAEEAKSMQELKIVLANPSQWYEVSTKTSSKQRYLDTALGYIWKSIGQAGQQKLAAVAALNGESDPSNYIKQILISQTTPSSATKVLPTNEMGGTGSGANGETGMKSTTTFQMFHKDKLRNPDMTFAFNDPKLNVLFRGAIGAVGPLLTPEGQSIPMATISNVLKTGLNQIVDVSGAFYGNKKLSEVDTNSLVYDGADVAKVYMPVGKGGGPDYEGFQVFKEIYAVYEANKDKWDTKTAENYFAENGFNLQIDETYEDGKRVKVIRDNNYVKPFLIIPAYTTDATTLTTGNENWLTQLNSDQEDQILPLLKQAWTVGTGKAAKVVMPKDSWSYNDKIFKGMVAIPYRKGAAAIVDSMSGQGPRERVSLMSDVQRNMLYTQSPATGSASVMNLKNE